MIRRYSPPDQARSSCDSRGPVLPPVMPTDWPCALMQSAKAGNKPRVFADLPSLARGILRRRHGQALQLKPDRIMHPSGLIGVVGVYAVDQVGNRTRFIGYAWLNGKDWRVLEAALAKIEPPLSVAA